MSRLYTSDIYDFSQLPNPLEVGIQPYSRYEDYDLHVHPEVGTLQYRNIAFPFLHIADMRWQTEKAVELHNHVPTDAIGFVFHLNGKQNITYNSISKTFELTPGKHFCAYEPYGDFFNKVRPEENIEVFHLSLDRSFFASVLDPSDSWSENILSNLEMKTTFTGVPFLLDITPQMWDLIKCLRVVRPSTGTASNLYVQSKALELIALQIEQMQIARQPESSQLKTEDIKKLNELKEYLDVNFLTEMSLVQLSRLSYLNEFKLKNGFKTLFGTTVFGYLRMLKMEHAAKLLRDAVPISIIAYELGYQYPHHFSVAFKNYMGVNPSIYQSLK